ncbi:hypothetical protein ACS0TY_036008 [Phlomoides rotata]
MARVFVLVLFLISTTAAINVTYIENAVARGIVCLDGSPGAYYYDRGFGEGVNNLMVYLTGGGWCENKQNCLKRSNTAYGSNKNAPSQYFGTFLSSNETINPDFYNWNKISILYCDGASFMADVEAVDPETNLHLRGARIFRAAIEEVIATEMLDVTNAILVGTSAGGLATMLNCDRFRSFFPDACNVKCVSDSGFFIDAKCLPGAEKRESYYSDVIAFHELADALPTSCTSRINSSFCLFPENFIGDIQTPLFVLNSAFDKFQISNKLQSPPVNYSSWSSCLHNISTCTAYELQYMKEFRAAFLSILNDVGYNPSTGMFISSCYIHDFIYKNNKWSISPMLENETIAKAIGDWFFDRCQVCLIDKVDTPIDCDGDN